MRRPSIVMFMRKHVNLPALLAHRMQRYSMALMAVAVVLLGFNLPQMTLEKALWLGAGLTAVFAILCGVAVSILDAIAWNFEQLREELGVGIESAEIK